MSKLTRSQRRAVETAHTIVHDSLQESDLSGALCDLQGNPILKPGGGFWNHEQEVREAYTGLSKTDQSLMNSLQKPNLAPDVRAFL